MNEQAPIEDEGTKEVRGFHKLVPNELQEAERRRQEKARQTTINTGQPPVPGPVEQELAERMAKIIPLAQKNQAQAEAQQKQMLLQKNAENIEKLRTGWNAPKRQIAQRNLGYSKKPNGEKWARTFAEKVFPRLLGRGSLIALLGERGPGKTQLAVEAMFQVTEMLHSAKYVTAMEIFLAVKKAYKKDSPFTEESIVNSFCGPQLLVIDEAHERGETEWEDRILTHILDRRYRDQKDTILIANLTRDAFDVSMGKSVVQRLNETGGTILCDWPGFREGV